MTEVEAFMAMQRGERVRLPHWDSGDFIEIAGNKVRSSSGAASYLATSYDWEIVPREPTLLELAKKVWPPARVVSMNACSAIDRAIALDSERAMRPHTVVVESGTGFINVSIAPTKAQAERRARIALEAIIKAEGL